MRAFLIEPDLSVSSDQRQLEAAEKEGLKVAGFKYFAAEMEGLIIYCCFYSSQGLWLRVISKTEAAAF